MDSVFQLSNGDRVRYLRNLMHSFGSSYICLWTYSPHLNILYCEDGHFQAEASSSAGVSTAETLFNEYKQCVINVGNSIVPGLAFRDKNPCLELQELDLQSLSCSKSQRQFYLEANVKTALFLGCERGEIELGMSNIPQNLETKMQRVSGTMEVTRVSARDEEEEEEQSGDCWWSRYKDEEGAVTTEGGGRGMIEMHMDDKEYYRTTTGNIDNPSSGSGAWLVERRAPFPSAESTDAALTKAYLAILSSSPPCSSSSSSQSYPVPPLITRERTRSSAFASYHHHQHSYKVTSTGSEKSSRRTPESSSSMTRRITRQRPTLFKRAVAFYRGLHFRRIALQGSSPNPTPPATRPTSNQLHHMISERRRREKINDSFQALRSLLPQPTKKDKASVLRTTQEYLSSLKAQVSELNTRNQELEAKLATVTSRSTDNTTQSLIGSGNETLAVQLIPAGHDDSTSTQRLVDLRLLFRGEASLSDLVIRLLPFLKQHTTLVSIQAQAHNDHQQFPAAEHQIPTSLVTFRLMIQGDEWDESAFITAVRRLLADLTG